jgi:hypothetical protein
MPTGGRRRRCRALKNARARALLLTRSMHIAFFAALFFRITARLD